MNIQNSRRRFEKFAPSALGSESDRKQLVDALDDMILPVDPKEKPVEFPQNNFAQAAKKTMEELLAREALRGNYAESHPGLAENIQTDILEWLQKTNDELEKENPFWEEAIFIEQQKKLTAQQIAEDIARKDSLIRGKYCNLPSVDAARRGDIAESNVDFDFYQKQFVEEKQNYRKSHKNKNTEKHQHNKQEEKYAENYIEKDSKEKYAEHIEILRRNFIADLEKALVERQNAWEMKRIDERRRKFLEELYRKIENFKRLEKLLLPFIGDLGRLWDLSSRPFEESGFELLETYAKLLENDASLQELAKMLGRQSRAQALFEKELRDKIVIKSEWHPKPAWRGEINGIRYSNDIASVVPSELALLRNPAAKKLFQLKFAQKQLLSFDYQNDASENTEETIQEEVSAEKKEPQGPVIICADTSGSMHGTPENIAKTIAFALAKIAMEEKRKCYLISFSTGIETLDMSDFQDGGALNRLGQFLRMSFHGGTDAGPALEHSLKMLREENYKNADVLMVSDFVMGSLAGNLVQSIEAEKQKNTCFYSLVIGSSGNQNTIQCFNHNWTYDTSDPTAPRRLAEQLHEIRQRNTNANTGTNINASANTDINTDGNL